MDKLSEMVIKFAEETSDLGTFRHGGNLGTSLGGYLIGEAIKAHADSVTRLARAIEDQNSIARSQSFSTARQAERNSDQTASNV